VHHHTKARKAAARVEVLKQSVEPCLYDLSLSMKAVALVEVL